MTSGLSGMGVLLLFIEQNSPMAVMIVFGTVVLIIGIMIAYVRITNHYRE
ncbi:MAG: hypothetical protein LUC90_03870 [Lachnospiraceae bacterium]|nr:hypothetical protein [Lachnospiraceae bacterium]